MEERMIKLGWKLWSDRGTGKCYFKNGRFAIASPEGFLMDVWKTCIFQKIPLEK